MDSHHLVPNASFGMDGLCNFEPNRLYASIDMHQEETMMKAGPETARQRAGKIDMEKQKESQADNHSHEAFNNGGMMEETAHEDNETTMLIKRPVVNSENVMTEFENVAAGWRAASNSPKSSIKSRLSESSSSSSKRIKLQTYSHQQSPICSHTTGHNESVLEEDTEDLDDETTSRCMTLVDTSQINFMSENIVMCINAGGDSISNTSVGSEFLEDCHFIGGDVLRTGETIVNTKDSLIYQTARYGNFSYLFKDIPSEEYIVDLHFAEIIFTNGPPGMRVFDVLIQDHKVVAELDVYSLVGSNTPLIIMNIRATVKEEGLLISFRSIAGSPCLSAICIRMPESREAIQYVGQLHSSMGIDGHKILTQHEKVPQIVPNTEVVVSESLQPQLQEHQLEKEKSKSKKRVQEYELKIQELKNEVHQAWLSVQDANRQNEKLQSELDCRSLHVDSLAQAVERQLFDLNEMKDQAANEKQEWGAGMLQIAMKYQSLKTDYVILAKEAHEWVNSFPAIQCMTEKVQALVDELEDLKKKYIKQGQDLRSCYNQVLELKGNIRVFCRCRPLNTTEMSMGASSVVEFESTRDNELVVRSNGTKKTFKFDRVFSPTHNQSDVFLDTARVVVSVLDGYNVCIFAYGQTGTGKTFTMEGTVHDRGVNYRTLEELFELTAKRKGQHEYTISVSVVEVYNEQIRDLLAQPLPPGQCAKKLEIKQVAEGVHHVPGLTEATVHCMEEVWDVLQTGSSARAVGSTNANEHSSRSHCMLCVMVKGENLLTGEYTRSKLWLVDLAGSERVAKTDVQGERLKETQSINKSLSALGDVIHALATKSSHVPYRNSKLTHLLQDSLGGESKTLMFVQISPSELDAGETLCSLNFASRVRGVELGPARKQLDSTDTVKYKQMSEKLKQDARVKDETLKKQEDSIKRLEDTLKMKEQAFRTLSDKVRDNEKAKSIAECKLRDQQSLAEHKLKEQQALIEKLQEELKTRELLNCKQEQRRMVEPLKGITNVDGLSNVPNRVKNMAEPIPDSKMKLSAMTDSEPEDTHVAKAAITSGTAPLKAKITGKTGRASLAGAYRKRASMVPAYAPPPPLAAQDVTFNAMDSMRSSSDSLLDSYPDENMLPNLQPSVACLPVISSPRSAGWKKGTAITPSTVLRRSIPRKIHFRSPHLQPSYLKGAAQGPPPPAFPVGDREGHQVAAKAQNKRDQNDEGETPGGAYKMRRVSIATGRPQAPFPIQQQPWNATTTVLPASGPRRVPVGNARTGTNRERAWNR
ncbi:hypothetical protein GOP47_0022601 [Adiantum capillus-veneris]|uniref:Kinesin motor domain-containing protein n=1 Tax=Adiantum capillus-veneris TaxID=13818 RepID=A0A9D4Z667_ADICA|nr:hypothetical protein GOP47_0022601 [Adiantum capillus-veneris]